MEEEEAPELDVGGGGDEGAAALLQGALSGMEGKEGQPAAKEGGGKSGKRGLEVVEDEEVDDEALLRAAKGGGKAKKGEKVRA